MRDVFSQRHRGYDSVARSQALNLLLSSSSLSGQDVADIAAQTTDRWNSDYSLYVQARLFDAARRNHTIRFVRLLQIMSQVPENGVRGARAGLGF